MVIKCLRSYFNKNNIYNYAKIFFFALIIWQEVYQYIDYKDDVDLHEKLAEWEAFYNCHRPHSAHAGKTPYEVLKNKLGL